MTRKIEMTIPCAAGSAADPDLTRENTDEALAREYAGMTPDGREVFLSAMADIPFIAERLAALDAHVQSLKDEGRLKTFTASKDAARQARPVVPTRQTENVGIKDCETSEGHRSLSGDLGDNGSQANATPSPWNEKQKPRMAGLSKSRLIAWRQCPKRLWLQINQPDLAVWDNSQNARMASGNDVGEVARSLWPDGVLIDSEDLSQALDDTRAALATGKPIFEATFQHEGALIRADLLLPEEGGYRLAEVKSSTRVKPYHLADAAIQAWISRQAGITLSHVEIAHIDTSFVYPGGGDYRGLFKHEDVTKDIASLEAEVPEWIAGAHATLAGDQPVCTTGDHCHDPFDCPFFEHCSMPDDNPPRFPVELLPYGRGLPASLRAEGYADLRDVPREKLSNPKHLRVWRVTRSGQPDLLPEAGDVLRALAFPRYYLDFETFQFVVPEWPGTRPYAQQTFQWSCHIEATDRSLTQAAFLADGNGDPRRAFAESMLAALGTAGPVIVYNAGFERGRIQELARDFPDLAPALEDIIARIFDLLPLARANYYHPDMQGSWSIKAVLPTIAPDLAYDDLEVAHGGAAQEAFGEIMHPDTTPERRRQLREALLQYCERDTLAMVRIAHHFEGR